jgi:TolA-binding protein
MKHALLLFCPLLALFLLPSCATAPARVYHAPNADKMNAAHQRYANAVDAAHAASKRSQAHITSLQKRQKEIEAEVKKLKDVPQALVQKIEQQDAELVDAQKSQTEEDSHFKEADSAKVKYESEQQSYEAEGKRLAEAATSESKQRYDAQSQLHWYHMHSLYLKIGGILLAVLIIGGVILKLVGKFPLIL